MLFFEKMLVNQSVHLIEGTAPLCGVEVFPLSIVCEVFCSPLGGNML